MFKDDYKSMMDDVPVNEALRAELLEKAQKAEESKSNVVKIPFIRRHTKSIASIAACVVIAAAAVGVVPNLMEEETPETTEVYEIPTSTKTPAPIQTDEEYEAALAAEATEVPESEEDTALAEVTAEPSAVNTPEVVFGTNTGIVQSGTALQTSAPAAAADESKTQTSGSSSESAQTASGETAHTHTAVTTEETETASLSAARTGAVENTDTDAAAGISTTALEEEATAVTAAPAPAVSSGSTSHSTSSSSVALPSGALSSGASSGSSSSGSVSSSSSSSSSVSSSSSASSSSSSSSSARSYSRSVIDYDSAAAYVENASHVFIVNGVKVGAYESGGTWKAYYTADNVGYVVTFTGYDSLSDIKEAIKVYI